MDSTSTSTLSYRPYKSKRHSRTISAEVSALHINPDASAHRPVSITLSNGHVATSSPSSSKPAITHGPPAPSLSGPRLVSGSIPTPPSAASVFQTPTPTLSPRRLSTPSPASSSSNTELTPIEAPALLPSSSELTPTSSSDPSTPIPAQAPALVASSSKLMTETPAPTSSPANAPTSTFRRVAPPSQLSPLRPSQHARSLTTSPSFSRRRFDSQTQLSHPSSSRNSSPTIPTNSLPTPTPTASAPSSAPASPRPIPTATPPPSVIQHAPSFTSSSSTSASPSTVSSRRPAPYRPGFQPKGVYRPLTDEFLVARSAVRDRDRVEQRRLERRLEKVLIALHFSTETLSEKPKPSGSRRSSLLLDLSKNSAELWRDVIQRSKTDIRAEEQSITPWQEDSSVSHCPLCTTSFHPLTNRKHHCRLCGRIVCARIATQTCSLLFVVDQKTGVIEEVGEGVDYGVSRKGEDERFLKGVRVCRECRVVLSRKQYLHEAGTVPTYVRLYSTLMGLEKEIEDNLPHFQELVLSLSTNTPATMHDSTANLRARLLASFSEYDRLAKRIRQLPATRGSSQDRVQGAILTRANLFLQKNMFPLQTLPKQSAKKAEEVQGQSIDKDSALAHALQPLLEQEALLEAYVEEAKAQRKFEDAKTLKESLGEIRAEIERISSSELKGNG